MNADQLFALGSLVFLLAMLAVLAALLVVLTGGPRR